MKLSKIAMVNGARVSASLTKKAAIISNSSTCVVVYNQPKVPANLSKFAKNSE